MTSGAEAALPVQVAVHASWHYICQDCRDRGDGKMPPRFGEDVHPPAAPISAYRFTSAGGRAADLDDGAPRVGEVRIRSRIPSWRPAATSSACHDERHHH